MKILVTGSSGYYGQILCKFLNESGYVCYGIDVIDGDCSYLSGFSKLNLTNPLPLKAIFAENKFSTVIHLASLIDFAVVRQADLYVNNVKSTESLLSLCIEFGVKKIIFTSSNSIYLGNREELINEQVSPIPIDDYGRSKVDSENLLNTQLDKIDINIIRCPNIIDAGRVGMLSILFELLESGATLWMLNRGEIRHQTIYAEDLNNAILGLLNFKGSSVHNIGCDEVKNFSEIFSYLINRTKSKSKTRSLPGFLILPVLRLAYKLKISPLGPYQFRMLTRDFQFDTNKIKKDLNWTPTKNNAEILEIAYDFYINNKNQITKRGSANSGKVNMGILNLLKIIKF